jgi:aminopeptidase
MERFHEHLEKYAELAIKVGLNIQKKSIQKELPQQIFPELSEDKSVEKLWDMIFKVTRVEQDDPVHYWDNHIQALNKRAAHLNSKKYKTLHYHSKGTDLSIELPREHQWLSARFSNKAGTSFVPNMPNIDGETTDGKLEPIFRKGDWAF